MIKRAASHVAKKFLMQSNVRTKLSKLYCGDAVEQFAFASLIPDNVWIFSLPKSGVSLICNVIAFYNAERNGFSGYDFASLSRLGVIRCAGRREGSFADALSFCRNFPKTRLVVHTHKRIDFASPSAIFLVRRDPYDFCVSGYHFFYENRSRKKRLSIDAAIPLLVRRYSAIYRMQNDIARQSENCHLIMYEQLMSDQYKTLARIVEHLHDEEVDGNALNQAIQSASITNVKKYESVQGSAIVAGQDYTGASFIRSGKVGESREFFNSKHIHLIENLLEKQGVSIDGCS